MKSHTKALLLDMDGTVREPSGDRKFISNPEDQRLIKGARSAIAYFLEKEYLIIGVTNQGGVAAGHKSLEACIEEQQRTISLCPAIFKIYFCPDFEGKQIGCVYSGHGKLLNPIEDYSSFRKPGAGMINYIFDTHNIDISHSLYVGDRQEDRDCIKNLNCSFIWAEEWRSLFGEI